MKERYERRIREKVKFHSSQFGFMPGRGIIDAIFILREVDEKIFESSSSRHWILVDLKKAFDQETWFTGA
jgi:Reverse transcriptase (RNA-dependent DNA polymerase)